METILEQSEKEKIAIEAFKEYRIMKGIECKKCGCQTHYWLNSKHQFQCKRCKFRTTLRSGTILEGSKLPVYYFFIAINLLVKNGNNATVEELQKDTSHKYYDPLWDFLKRIKDYVRNEKDQKLILLKYIDVLNNYAGKREHVL